MSHRLVSARVPADTRPNAWAAELERQRRRGAELLDLTEQNPTRVGLAGGPELLEALADARGARYAPHPLGLLSAREAVAGYYASRGLTVHPDDVMLVSGTSEAYAHLLRLCCDPGDRVLAPVPSYPLLEPLAALEGVEVEGVPLALSDRWRWEAPALEDAIDARTRAVVVVEPNHPTGSCLDAGERARVEAACRGCGLACIADEVFGDFLWNEREVGVAPSWLGERPMPTFVLQGLSKLCGLPQLKLSWIVLAGPAEARHQARRALEWIGDAFLSVSTPVQLALPALLESRLAFRARTLARVLEHRAALERAAHGTGATVPPAAGGWVSLLRLPEGSSGEALALRLLEDGVVAHPGHFYDDPEDRHLVVSLIVAPETFTAGLERLVSRLGDARSGARC